jgi:V/A-type H+/Na+-transporting ATPase subunit E
MGTDVASFAKQLKEDGIEAAKAEAEKILDEAQKKADKIINAAKAESDKLEKETQTRIQQNRTRSEDEMRLVARDLLISFRKKIEEVGVNLLQGQVAEALNNGEVIKTAITELLKEQSSGKNWEVSLSGKLGPNLAQVVVNMFKAKGADAKLGETLLKAGFEVRHGNEVFEITEDSITESFKKLLSPELKKLLES